MNQLDKAISFWQFNRHLLNALGHNWLRQASQLATTHTTRHTQADRRTARHTHTQHVNSFIIMNMRIFVCYVCDSDSDSNSDSVGCDCGGAQWDSGTVGHGLVAIQSRLAEQSECAQV